MSRQRNKLLLVDALNLIRRVYAAQPGEEGADKAAGARTSSVQSLERALRENTPTHAVCVFDGKERSWRHELYPDYKAGHKAMPEALASALGDFRDAFRQIGVASLRIPAFEADDTAAHKASAAGISVIILSTDKSFLQLLQADIRIRDHFRRADLDAAHAREKFGVRPDQLVDFLALAGDRGNGIPGVPGVGTKSAAKLLGRFETLEAILDRAGELEGKLGERLRGHAETVRLYRKLVALRTDLELGANLSDWRYRPASVDQGR